MAGVAFGLSRVVRTTQDDDEMTNRGISRRLRGRRRGRRQVPVDETRRARRWCWSLVATCDTANACYNSACIMIIIIIISISTYECLCCASVGVAARGLCPSSCSRSRVHFHVQVWSHYSGWCFEETMRMRRVVYVLLVQVLARAQAQARPHWYNMCSQVCVWVCCTSTSGRVCVSSSDDEPSN